jgi:hypothetical protein
MATIADTSESSGVDGSPVRASLPTVRRSGARLFVWGVWALMLLAALAYVKTYGADSPLWDEYDGYVVALTGEQPVTINWLWTQYGPHRFPLPKLIVLGSYRLIGDFRAAI